MLIERERKKRDRSGSTSMASTSSQSAATSGGQEESGDERALTGLLSDDTLLHLMHCLPTRDLLTSLALVCRRWHRLCNAFGVHELVPWPLSSSLKPWGNVSDKQLFELAMTHASTLERVHCPEQSKGSDIVALCQNLPKLVELSIAWGSTRPDLELVANQLPSQLLSLDLHLDRLYHGGSNQLCHNCIQTISPKINDGILESIYQRCPRLQKLALDEGNISQQGLNGLLQACPSLTSLDLYSHGLGWPDVAKVFTSCRSLRHFSLVSNQLIASSTSSDDDESIDSCARGCRRRNAQQKDGMHSEAAALGAVVPKQLKSLRLYRSSHQSIYISPEPSPVLAMLRASGQQFQHFHAQGAFNASWHTISFWCPNLKLLDLSHNTREALVLTEVEEVVLRGLIRLLKKLEHVALPSASDGILTELGLHCPNLEEVRIQSRWSSIKSLPCKTLTDRGVVALAEGCPALRVLSVAGCRNVTVASARALAFHCRQLHVLVLNGCSMFKDDAVAALLPRLSSSLVLLDLAGCRITKATLETISEYGKVTSLRIVAIGKGLWNQLQEEITRLQSSNPRLKVKSVTGIVWDGFYHRIALD